VTTSPCPPYICLQFQPSYGIHTRHLHELNTTMRGATLKITYVEFFYNHYISIWVIVDGQGFIVHTCDEENQQR
jgi:hypothetical protein